MKDGRWRRAIKRLARWVHGTDLRCTRLIQRLRGEPQFRLGGHCNGCGACCETPMIQTHAILFRLRTTRWLILTWHRLVNGFEYLDEDRRAHVFVFRCTHYDPETKLCDAYDSRPVMCRDYPRNLTYDPNPTFLPACSYYAIDENAERLRSALEELDLPAEELAELKRRLHVRDDAIPSDD